MGADTVRGSGKASAEIIKKRSSPKLLATVLKVKNFHLYDTC